jgi:hypothetical protein
MKPQPKLEQYLKQATRGIGGHVRVAIMGIKSFCIKALSNVSMSEIGVRV